MSKQTKLLTGIPRSGTTLCCSLLNNAPDVVALHEPISPDLFTSTEEPLALIKRELDGFRSSLRREGKAQSKQLDGVIPTNPVAKVESTRKEIVTLGEIKAQKQLSENFELVVKHNALFAALLPELTGYFDVYCVVRNPLPVLASWLSVDLPVSKGIVPMAEKFDRGLKEQLASMQSTIDRQLRILAWFFDRFRENSVVISYEDLVETNGQGLFELMQLTPGPMALLEPELKNSASSPELLFELASLLRMSPEIYQGFYSVDDIDTQLEAMLD